MRRARDRPPFVTRVCPMSDRGFVFLLACLLLLCLHCFVENVSTTGEESYQLDTCDRTRHVLRDAWGVVTDGPGKYLPNTHCQWLIQGEKDFFLFSLL
jgi:hypothetical protein